MKNLKKISLSCIALLMLNGCCITPPNCSPDGGNVSYGPDVSYRSSKYVGSDASDQGLNRAGSIGVGVFAHWIFCEDYPEMGFFSGLFYNQFGSTIEYTEDDMSKDRLHYLSIPFTYTYDVFEGIRIEAGPDLSFLLSAKEKNEYMGQKETYDFKEQMHNIQFGYNIAVSYTHEETGLGGYFRYNGAFNKIPSSEYDTKIFNSGFSFGARYRINHLLKKSN